MSVDVLVTGGSGYFGSLMLRKLHEKGESCRNFDIIPPQERLVDEEFQQGDIRNPEDIVHACRGIRVVYHNVAQVPLAKDKSLFRSVNIDGTRNLLDAALKSGVQKVIYTSSSAVYGVPDSNPVNEHSPKFPGDPYGQAKLDGEKLCLEYREKGLDVSIIRPRTIMGHGRLGIFQILFEWIFNGHNVPVLGKGDNQYQFVHAYDLADACLLAAQRPGAADYNCGTDRFGTMREVLEGLCGEVGTGSRVKSVPMWPATMGMKITSMVGLSPLSGYHSLMYGRSLYFDISKIQEELGWQPKYSNDEMFMESYAWYLKHRDHILGATGASHHRSSVNEGILSLVRKFL
ncbi:NAD-dependent epimerase/dehydratase family protein [Candidatus Neomarinimicrobiota bacterium]